MENAEAEGLIDTNVFIFALSEWHRRFIIPVWPHTKSLILTWPPTYGLRDHDLAAVAQTSFTQTAESTPGG